MIYIIYFIKIDNSPVTPIVPILIEPINKKLFIKNILYIKKKNIQSKIQEYTKFFLVFYFKIILQ